VNEVFFKVDTSKCKIDPFLFALMLNVSIFSSHYGTKFLSKDLPITIAFTFLKAFKKKKFPLQLILIAGPQGHGIRTSSTLQLKIVPFYVFYYSLNVKC
jgi:hypothetical protein